MKFRSAILLLLPVLFIVLGVWAHNIPILALGVFVPASFLCDILCLFRGIKIFKSQIWLGLVFIMASVVYLTVTILLLMPAHAEV